MFEKQIKTTRSQGSDSVSSLHEVIQNDCHQWLSHSFRVHQFRFRPGLCPRLQWGSL